MTDVEILTNQGELVIREEKINVKPYTWMETLQMVKHLKVVLSAIGNNMEKLQNVVTTMDSGNTIVAFTNILSIIDEANDGDALVNAIKKLVSVGIKRDEKFVEDLDVEEIFEAGKVVFEVNKDFFGKVMGKMKITPNMEANE